jgi:hypothetical protein
VVCVILWNSEVYILDQEEIGVGVGRVRAAIEYHPIVPQIIRSFYPGCVPLPEEPRKTHDLKPI